VAPVHIDIVIIHITEQAKKNICFRYCYPKYFFYFTDKSTKKLPMDIKSSCFFKLLMENHIPSKEGIIVVFVRVAGVVRV